MDEEQLKALISNFTNKGEHQGSDEDYKDFLVNYMNAVNHGAQDDQLKMMADSISPERRGAMDVYNSQLGMESDPTIQLERNGLTGLLRGK